MNWLAFLIGLAAVVGSFLLMEAVRGLFRWLERKGVEVEEGVKDALFLGVQTAWDDVVREWKDAAEDGKLTSQEKKRARAYAKATALKLAKGPVKDALIAMAPDAVNALISLLVQRRKEERPSTPKAALSAEASAKA